MSRRLAEMPSYTYQDKRVAGICIIYNRIGYVFHPPPFDYLAPYLKIKPLIGQKANNNNLFNTYRTTNLGMADLLEILSAVIEISHIFI